MKSDQTLFGQMTMAHHQLLLCSLSKGHLGDVLDRKVQQFAMRL
jgi:hypothetical protein